MTGVNSAQAALDAYQQTRPDLLVGDIGMAGEDGYSLIRRLRALERSRGVTRVPALALTAFTREADRERAFNAGFDRYLGKPVEPVVVLDTLRELASGA